VVLDIESHASRLAIGRIISALPDKGKDALVALFESAPTPPASKCCGRRIAV
jgi:hypothetical protein